MTDLLTLLSEWDERREKATAGPWEAMFAFGSSDLPCAVDAGKIEICHVRDWYTEENNPTPNFRFIAAARTEHERLSQALRNAVVFLNTLIEFKSQHPHNYPILLEVKSLALDHLTDIETILKGEQ